MIQSPNTKISAEIAQAAYNYRELQYAKNPWKWACEQVQTLDEASSTVRRFPISKAYLEDYFSVLMDFKKVLLVPKSRRMLISIATSTFCAHQARFHPNKLILISSKREKEATYFVDQRIAFIESHLIDERPKAFHSWRTKDGLIGQMQYDETGSWIIALPEKGDAARSYTFSLLVMDESDFQQQGQISYNSILPQLESDDIKDVRVIILTTSNGPNHLMSGLLKRYGYVRWEDFQA